MKHLLFQNEQEEVFRAQLLLIIVSFNALLFNLID